MFLFFPQQSTKAARSNGLDTLRARAIVLVFSVAYFVQPQISGLSLQCGVGPVVIALACLIAGALLYRFVEAPFMAIRKHVLPTNFRFVGPFVNKMDTVPASR